MAVINNKKGKSALIRLTGTGTVALTDLQIGSEVVTEAAVTSVAWSSAGTITVARGANTIFALSGSGQWNLNEGGGAIAEDSPASIVVTMSGAGTILLGVSKKSSITGLEQP